MSKTEGGWRAGMAPLMMAVPASLFLAVLSLPGPRIGQVAGVVNISAGGAAGFMSLLHGDPDLQLVDQRWNGHLIFVVSQKVNFVQLARQSGALVVFDAKGVGCNFSSQNSSTFSMQNLSSDH